MGADGLCLLQAVESEAAPAGSRDLPAMQVLRHVWEQQCILREGCLSLRTADERCRAGLRLGSPYDPEAHFGNKRRVPWTGYKVLLTEICDEELPHLITDVQTTAPDQADVSLTEPIQEALEEKGLLPSVLKARSVNVGCPLRIRGEIRSCKSSFRAPIVGCARFVPNARVPRRNHAISVSGTKPSMRRLDAFATNSKQRNGNCSTINDQALKERTPRRCVSVICAWHAILAS